MRHIRFIHLFLLAATQILACDGHCVSPSIGDSQPEVTEGAMWQTDTSIVLDDDRVVVIQSQVYDENNDCRMCTVDVRLQIRKISSGDMISSTPLDILTHWGMLDGVFQLIEYQGNHALAFTTAENYSGDVIEVIQIYDLDEINKEPLRSYSIQTACDGHGAFNELPNVVQNALEEQAGHEVNPDRNAYHLGKLDLQWRLNEAGDMEFWFCDNRFDVEPIQSVHGLDFLEFSIPPQLVVKPGPWSDTVQGESMGKNPCGNPHDPSTVVDKACGQIEKTLNGEFINGNS